MLLALSLPSTPRRGGCKTSISEGAATWGGLFGHRRFLIVFGSDDRSASEIVDSFRSFVGDLPDRPDWDDSHWSTQAALAGVSKVDYHHVGRLESLGQTEADLRRYVGQRGGRLPPFGTDNGTLLPFSPGLFDRPTRAACLRLTADDRRTFGYEPVPDTNGEPDERWLLTVKASIPALRALIERHERLLDVWRMNAEGDVESGWRRAVAVAGRVATAASAATLVAARRISG